MLSINSNFNRFSVFLFIDTVTTDTAKKALPILSSRDIRLGAECAKAARALALALAAGLPFQLFLELSCFRLLQPSWRCCDVDHRFDLCRPIPYAGRYADEMSNSRCSPSLISITVGADHPYCRKPHGSLRSFSLTGTILSIPSHFARIQSSRSQYFTSSNHL